MPVGISAIWVNFGHFGLSASDGPYLRRETAPVLPLGRGIDDYRETVLGQDASFAWHHLQIWTEAYEARFEVPRLGDVNTLGYFIEVKCKFAPQLFGAVRWNQQFFSGTGGGNRAQRVFGNDLIRAEASLAYRFTPRNQLKVQYTFEQEQSGARVDRQFFAGQFTVRF